LRWNKFPSGVDMATGSFANRTTPPVIKTNPSSFKIVDNRTLNIVNQNLLVRWTGSFITNQAGYHNFRISGHGKVLFRIGDYSTSYDSNADILHANGDNTTFNDVFNQSNSPNHDIQATTPQTSSVFIAKDERIKFIFIWWLYAAAGNCDIELAVSYGSSTNYHPFHFNSPSWEMTQYQPSFTCTRTNSGRYTITFSELCQPRSNTYTILLTLEHSEGFNSNRVRDDYIISYSNKTSTGFNVEISEQDNSTTAGVYRDNKFDFCCISRGKIFCHGALFGGGNINQELGYG